MHNGSEFCDAASANELSGVMSLVEAERLSQPGASETNISAVREQLAVVVFTGEAQEANGVQLTDEPVKHLRDKDVKNYFKSYESYVGARTAETLIESFLPAATKAVGMVRYR